MKVNNNTDSNKINTSENKKADINHENKNPLRKDQATYVLFYYIFKVLETVLRDHKHDGEA